MAQVSESYEAHTKKIDADGEVISSEVIYLVFDANNEDAALTAVLQVAPQTLGEAKLSSLEISERAGEKTFKVSAQYDYKASENSSTKTEATESFECGGGTKHMSHAIEQTCVYSDDGEEEDDADGGIGWNGKFGTEAEYTGVDVPIADMRQSYTKTVSSSKMSTSYKKKVADLVGKVNSSSWKGWAAGEVMFLGMSASGPSKKKVTVTYNFRIIPNESDCKIAGKSIGSKKGFEYIWARNVSEVDDDEAKQKVAKIYKSKVCESGSFSALGI